MPSKKDQDFTTAPYPRSRAFVVDAARVAAGKHMIHGLVEFDVTEPRARLRDHKARTGEALSFTAFVLHCVGATVAEDRMIHACRDWRGRLLLFDDVDINTIIEIELEGRRFPLAHVVRATNRRTVRDIHDEIRTVQARGDRNYDDRTVRLLRLYTRLPGPLRRLAYRVAMADPNRMKRIGGTVSVTAVGMFGEGGGWGIPIPLYTLNLTLGGIATKPGMVGGSVKPREYLHVTLSFDHDIVDGAPAARFAARLRGLVEGAHGLEMDKA
ncbi:MAG: 2-oxo acid dehydrogenase subunit E2 [Candidatus Promineofilum sp.]|nr:2-oxo acid dehydrogenase subunit E2 [Promineifilum sp.]MBP9657615.1 2-oxo acid dehydrogenase subunit E2 [Promineifilum sp.]